MTTYLQATVVNFLVFITMMWIQLLLIPAQ